MANKFLVSVANAILRDANTGEALAVGKANMNSSITLSMQKTEVRGGINNPLLYTYFHDRNAEFKIEQVVFGKELLALNLGSTITNSSYTVVGNEDIVLSSGSGTLSHTALANCSVVMPNGAITTVTPTSGSEIYVSGGGGQKVSAVYTYTATADQVVATSTTPPDVVDLTLIAEVRDETGIIVEYLQVNVPRYQVSGNYTLSLAANGVSNESLDGVALVTTSTDSSADYYFKATWISNTTASIPVTSIAATPSVLTFSYASRPQTSQLNVLGIRGGVYANVNITTSCSYIRSSGCSTLTIGAATGLVTSTSAVKAGDNAMFQITYYDTTSGSLFDSASAVVGA